MMHYVGIPLYATDDGETKFNMFVSTFNKIVGTGRFNENIGKIETGMIYVTVPEYTTIDITFKIKNKFRLDVAKEVERNFGIDSQEIYTALLEKGIDMFNTSREQITLAVSQGVTNNSEREFDEIIDGVIDACEKIAPKYQKTPQEHKYISNDINYERTLTQVIPDLKRIINIATKEANRTRGKQI